jgi:predicted metal-dependent phosphoesterase TrpH
MLIDLHNHTGWGSGDSHVDPFQLIEQAQRWGLDGIAITDHDQLWDPEKVEMLRRRTDFFVAVGVEVDTDIGHVLVFGLEGPRRWLRLPAVEELRAELDRAGGVMIAAHPFQDLASVLLASRSVDEEWARLLQRYRWRLMDAIEVHNGRMGPQQREMAAELAGRLGLPTTGGSDSHRLMEVARSFTVFEDDIRSEQDLVEAIKSRRCRGGDWASEGLVDKRGRELSRPGHGHAELEE